jgi:5-methylthioadenosine/S-adenosylhomocysteine deaminase
MPANQVWHLATAGGADALGLKNVGCIKEGWQADLMLVNPKLPTPIEAHNLYDQLLLYCNANDVDTVMIAGKLRKLDGEVLNADSQALRNKVQKEADRLWKKSA